MGVLKMINELESNIKQVGKEELDNAFSLIWTTFNEFIAPDYTKEAVDNFKRNIIDNKEYKNSFISGSEVMYGAYVEEKLAGILSIRGQNFISCAFVDKKYHRTGVATKLFQYVIPLLKESGSTSLRLNSSPYAVPFYHSLGFKDLGKQQVYNGILFTPMELIL